MRKVWAAVVAVMALGAARADDPNPTPPEATSSGPVTEELRKMQGYWKPTSVRYEDSEQIPDAETRSRITLVIKDAEFRTYYCRDPKIDSHFRLFTAAVNLQPESGTFDLLVTDGQKKGERRHGLYEINGNTLKLCYGPTDKPRPTSFAAPKGSGYFYETWQVEKRQ